MIPYIYSYVTFKFKKKKSKNIHFHIHCREQNAQKRRGVLFADGVIPGEGTSASEESAIEDDDNIAKPKKLSSRAKGKKNAKDMALPTFSTVPSSMMFLEKENSFEIKVGLPLFFEGSAFKYHFPVVFLFGQNTQSFQN